MKRTGKIAGSFLLTALAGLFVYSFNLSGEFSYNAPPEAPNKNTPDVVEKKVKHVKTPKPVKAVYMTQCFASRTDLRKNLVKLIEDTELNSLVIDIKDYTGTVSFKTMNPEIDAVSAKGSGCQVNDMKEFVEELHDKNIYVIGRITVFQDPLYTKLHPELAVKKLSDKEAVWKDRKGLSFVDVGAKPFWDYILAIATSSYSIGFDEINFDYIRFPSDGDMNDIYFSHTGSPPAGGSKKEMLREFFRYVDSRLFGTGVITSADIFGMTTTNTDDLNIGQVLEYALENFDYVAPMVYPSHYPPKFNGWPDPNKVPYEIVNFSMQSAVSRAIFLLSEVSTTTRSTSSGQATTTEPDYYLMKRINPLQLRPWLQDFDYPVPYTSDMVRKQIQATYDAGLDSWMLWDPRNEYTRSALLEK